MKYKAKIQFIGYNIKKEMQIIQNIEYNASNIRHRIQCIECITKNTMHWIQCIEYKAYYNAQNIEHGKFWYNKINTMNKIKFIEYNA